MNLLRCHAVILTTRKNRIKTVVISRPNVLHACSVGSAHKVHKRYIGSLNPKTIKQASKVWSEDPLSGS